MLFNMHCTTQKYNKTFCCNLFTVKLYIAQTSDNEEDSADFSDLSEEYVPLDSGFYSRKKDCSFIHQTIRTFYMRKSEGFNAFTRNLLDGTLILLNFYFLCASQ